MTDLTFLTALTTFVVTNAPVWLASLGGTFLNKSRDAAFDKGKDIILDKGDRLRHHIFHLDEKEQLRHLEQALKNATERGLVACSTSQERDLYQEIMRILSQPGATGEDLRRAVLQVFTLSEEPNLATLTDAYNNYQLLANPTHQAIDASLYLNSFFSALIGELYADPFFRPQLSDVLQLRAAKNMQRSLLEIISVLREIDETLANNYSADDLAQDIDSYIAYIERTLHHLKIVGIVPKDQNPDPELNGIFVPLRIALRDQTTNTDLQQTSLVGVLEQAHALVLLGGPGSGKSTATKHLAWSHVAASQPSLSLNRKQLSLLSGNPLPLRIELRLLSEERKRANYDFLAFAVEVLLKREGIEINPQMFKELLTRRAMVLFFDGLDEVATLEERLQLVNEIEHFALCYPGNFILVTSRPVGYELARFSHPLFSHAEVQAFDDTQIQQYLGNWYTSVLRLSPIPPREQEEMNLLLTTLQENPRLHKLAENPLLLTVITVLHRYERLPDRRVLVYDRCADLLLETWARLKGTHKRWQDMRLIKEEQYACIAYLGFVLHERSQEDEQNTTVDVTSRFLRKTVEDFLRKRKLIPEVAQRQAEAKRFIDLAQQEAGLIVERGTDENGEALYSFVHRTFQEYFAAADIYERYQQKEDPKIISAFLREHLHDPHWREVIILLLGKLKSTPVTNQLRQILQGKIKSKRSCYTQIVQQDLFFVCSCLVEEIKVENTLVEMVVSDLKNIVRSSWSPSQQKESLGFLGKLMQTRQYGEQGRKALMFFMENNGGLDAIRRLAAIEIFYLHSSVGSEERHVANQKISEIIALPALTVKQVIRAAESFYDENALGSKELHFAYAMLMELVKRPDLTVAQLQLSAEALYRSPEGSEAERIATTLLMELVKRPDLTAEQLRQSAQALYRSSPEGSEAQQTATTLLMELVKRPDLAAEQLWQSAEALYRSSLLGSEARQTATMLLMELVKRPDLTAEQLWQSAEALYRSPGGSEARQTATMLLMELVKRPDLTVEQLQQSAQTLYRSSPPGSEAERIATMLLMELVKRPDLTAEQLRQSAQALYRSSPEGSEAQQTATTLLMELVKRPDLTVEQLQQSAQALYRSSPEGSEARQTATMLLMELVKRPDLTIAQLWQSAEALYRSNPEGSEAQQTATMLLMELVKRPDLTVEQLQQSARILYRSSPPDSEARRIATALLLTQLSRSSQVDHDMDVYSILYSMIPQFHLLHREK